MTVEISQISAGSELDALVVSAVFGGAAPLLNYSTDIAAAWRVRERMEQLGWDSEDHQTGEDGHPCTYIFRFLRWQDISWNYLSKPIAEHAEVATVQQAPFAICMAAVRALAATRSNHR
jgi:hypothetical protein